MIENVYPSMSYFFYAFPLTRVGAPLSASFRAADENDLQTFACRHCFSILFECLLFNKEQYKSTFRIELVLINY